MNTKKWLSLLLAALMLMSMTTAFADISSTVIPEEEFNYIMPLANGSITITNATATHEYKAYKLFDVAYNAAGNYAYSIRSDNPWFNVLANYKSGTVFTFTQVGSSGVYVVTIVNGMLDDAAEAAELAKYLYNNVAEKTATASFTVSGNTAVTGDLSLGYYFVTSSLGSLCSLTLNNLDATIQDKNEKPTIEKQVKEDSTGEFGASNNAQIGDTVEFKTTIHAKPGAEGYVLHDKMSNGLTLNQNSIVVKVGENQLTKDTDYSVEFNKAHTTENPEDSYTCDFEITFIKNYLDTITANTDITVTYSAILNDNAVISTDANTNDTKLVYGDEVKSETAWAHTDTYTYKFSLLKTDDKSNQLEGAKFKLHLNSKTTNDTDEPGAVISFVKVDDATYRVATTSDTNTVQEIEAGSVSIKGLDAEIYWLEETTPPVGYNPLTAPIKVVVNGTDNLTYTYLENTSTNASNVTVVNTTGTSLPSTGGTGTTVLYAVGGVLVLAAFVLIVTKRRASEN